MDSREQRSIVHVLAPASFGGLERVVFNLASEQASRGHAVAAALVVDPGSGVHPLAVALRSEGVAVTTIESGARAYRFERQRIRDYASERAADVIHSHGYRPDIVIATLRRTGSPARVATIHGFTRGGWKNRLYETLQKRALGRYEAVVAVSAPQLAELERGGVSRTRIELIPNAWRGGTPFMERKSARHALSISPNAFHIGWIGRVSHEKGPDLFIAALAAAEPHIEASIIGAGPEVAQLRELYETSWTGARVTWRGMIPDAAQYMTAFDALVLTSRTEGTPIVMLEAMAAGVPIIATAVGGVPFVVGADEAFLIDDLDPAAIRAAIATVRDAPGEARRRAERARIRLDRDFHVDKWVERYMQVYENAIQARRGRNR